MPGPYFDAFTLPGDPGDVGKPAAALEEWLRIIYRRTKEEGVPITHWFFEAQHVSSKNRSEEHTSELQSLMRISYAVFCLKKKNQHKNKKKQQQEEQEKKTSNILNKQR